MMTDEQKRNWLEERLQAMEFINGYMGFLEDIIRIDGISNSVKSEFNRARDRWDVITIELARGFPE